MKQTAGQKFLYWFIILSTLARVIVIVIQGRRYPIPSGIFDIIILLATIYVMVKQKRL